MSKEHVENLNYRSIQPTAWDAEGVDPGATFRPLARDPEAGGVTGILDLPAGFAIRGPVRCSGEMQVFALAGSLSMGDQSLRAGTYSYYPEDAVQPSWNCESDFRALVIFGSAPRFERTQAKSLAPDTIAALDTWQMQWTNPLEAADPSVPFRTGVMVKVLRVDQRTGASTHLAGLMPGWFSYGMEVHPVYEENYCLSGDVHVAEVGRSKGYTMTEGAFLCRPQGIPHGPVLSKNGNVNFVYAHGRLGIDYVDNPRSEQLVDEHLRGFPWR